MNTYRRALQSVSLFFTLQIVHCTSFGNLKLVGLDSWNRSVTGIRSRD